MAPYIVARRRRQTRQTAAVSWRDGVHITDTPIWCDARRRRDVCFVSSAERIGRTGHGQLIATQTTLALLGSGDGGHLGVPLDRPFTLGTLRLELIASGRGLGAAALRVELADSSVLYAGAIRCKGPEPVAVRTSDAVVVAAPYPAVVAGVDLADARDQVITWTRAQLALGRHAVLMVESLLDAIELATLLEAAGLAVASARVIREAGRRLAADPEELRWSAPGKDPRATVWLASERAALGKALGDRPVSTALVSPRAGREVAGHDVGLTWPSVADAEALLAWIAATGAREIFVTGAGAEGIVARLGAGARIIGPPQQMSLFPRAEEAAG